MQCPNCHHENGGGKFCAKCGTPLVAQQQYDAQQFGAQQQYHAQGQAAATAQQQQQYQQQHQFQQQQYYSQPQQQAQPNPQLEAAKNASKMYFSYFLAVLKHPFVEATKIGSGQFTNGLVTIGLHALLLPLILYFIIDSDWYTPPFGELVLAPFIGIMIIHLLISVYTLMAVKLGKVNANFKDVIASYGALHIPYVALLVIGLIFSIIGSDILAVILAYIGLFLPLASAPVFLVSALKKNQPGGLDAVYGTLLVYVLTSITTLLLGTVLLAEFIDSFFYFY